MYPIITIDGPSGAGKGTLAYRLAQTFDFALLDSGVLYRIVGLMAYKAGLLDGVLSPTQDGALSAAQNDDGLAQALAQLIISLDIAFVAKNDQSVVIINGEPLSDNIRTETVGGYASVVAKFAQVRSALLALQQDFAKRRGVVADGRDMGTVVFPQATAKLFLLASPTARANRRVAQLQKMGQAANFETILAEIQRRDNQDENRPIAPSKPASDALIIDSSNLTADEVYKMALAYIRPRLAAFAS